MNLTNPNLFSLSNLTLLRPLLRPLSRPLLRPLLSLPFLFTFLFTLLFESTVYSKTLSSAKFKVAVTLDPESKGAEIFISKTKTDSTPILNKNFTTSPFVGELKPGRYYFKLRSLPDDLNQNLQASPWSEWQEIVIKPRDVLPLPKWTEQNGFLSEIYFEVPPLQSEVEIYHKKYFQNEYQLQKKEVYQNPKKISFNQTQMSLPGYYKVTLKYSDPDWISPAQPTIFETEIKPEF